MLFLSSCAYHPYSRWQADSCQYEGHRYDAQWHPRMEETRLWWQQGLLWKKDSTFYPWAKRKSSHLQAKRAAHSGVTSTDTYFLRFQFSYVHIFNQCVFTGCPWQPDPNCNRWDGLRKDHSDSLSTWLRLDTPRGGRSGAHNPEEWQPCLWLKECQRNTVAV